MTAEKLRIEELGVDLSSGQLSERLLGDLTNEEVERVSTEFSRTDRELFGKSILTQVERRRARDDMLDTATGRKDGGSEEYKKTRDYSSHLGTPDFTRRINQRAAQEFASTHLDQLDDIARAEMEDKIRRETNPQL